MKAGNINSVHIFRVTSIWKCFNKIRPKITMIVIIILTLFVFPVSQVVYKNDMFDNPLILYNFLFQSSSNYFFQVGRKAKDVVVVRY